MYVGIARIEYRVPGARSLKGKRHVLRKMLDRVRARFRVAAGEVDFLDKWQRTAVGLAVVGPDPAHLRRFLEEICRYLDSLGLAEPVRRQVEVIPFGPSEQSEAVAGGSEAPWLQDADQEADPLAGLDELGEAGRLARPVGDEFDE